MKKRILSTLILMIILIQSTGVILNQVVATTTSNEKVAKMDYFDTTAKIDISKNTRNITSRDQGGRGEETTILDNNGNFNFIYYDDNNVYIQRLNSNMQVKDTLTIAKKYPEYGTTIMDNSGNYYIAWGQHDLEDGDTGKITFSIAKYNNSGTFIKSYDVCDSSTLGATQVIFDLGACNMAISKNGILAYNYGKQMKNGHQCNDTGYVDINTMEAPDKYKAYPYTSHSMYTDVIALSTGEFVFMQQGDAYDRGYNLTLISQSSSSGSWLNHSIVPFQFREGSDLGYGYNYTFANYGGMEELDTGVALIAGSEKTLSLDPAGRSNDNESRNVFVQIIKKSGFDGPETADSFVTVGERASTGTQHTSSGSTQYFLKQGTKDYGVKWLTNYSGDYTAKNVKTVEVDNDRIAIFWAKAEINKSVSEDDEVYYMVIDNKGNTVQEATLLEMGSLPGYEKPIYKNGYVYFSNTDGTNKIRTYRVKLYETENKTEITVPFTSKTLNTPTMFKINATVKNGKELEYSSSNVSILEVSSDGTVTPKKNGTVTINVSVKDSPRVKQSISITVDILPQGVTLDKTKLTFQNSNYQTLEATIDPPQAEASFEWESSNELVARVETVSYNPNLVRIYPVGLGTCTITVSIKDQEPKIQATCEVTVIQKVTRINITESRIEIAKGEDYQLEYNVTPTNATNQEVTWSSSNEAVAKVDKKGIVTGVSDGNATITATSQENSSIKDTCNVIVEGSFSGNYSYEKLDDGTIKILKYKGNETNVQIPSKIDGYTVTQIGSYVFGESSNVNTTIKNITIPETITTIEDSAFAYCDAITTITIPKSVEEIGVNAFRNCTKLEAINVSEENTKYMSKDGVLFQKRDNSPIYLTVYPSGKKDTTYTLPNTIQVIEQWAINANPYIQEITILDNTYSMNYRAISECSNLTKVYIINENISMYSRAINDCDKVTIYSEKDSKAQTFAENNDIPFEAIDIKITDLKVTPGTMNFTTDSKSLRINVEVTPETATNKEIEYVSENEDIAAVTSNGFVYAEGNGTTRILVKTKDGSNITKVVNVVVDIKCTSITILGDSMTINGESTRSISAYVRPSNAANKKLSYSIKDTSIATIDQNGKITPLKNGETTIVLKTTDGSNITKEFPLKVTGIEKKLPFKDVKNSDWFFSSVEYCYEKGIILGTSDTTYNPNTKLTRGMLVTILHRMDGKPAPKTQNQFKDVYKSQYYYDAVIWANEKGIVHGYGDGSKFGPDDNITRQDLAVILRNFAQYKGKNINVTSDLSKFKDGNLVSDYAKTAMQWATGKGVITGNNNGESLTPHANSTRAEAAGMIYNYCTKVNV